jgi:hypothetical protein
MESSSGVRPDSYTPGEFWTANEDFTWGTNTDHSFGFSYDFVSVNFWVGDSRTTTGFTLAFGAGASTPVTETFVLNYPNQVTPANSNPATTSTPNLIVESDAGVGYRH